MARVEQKYLVDREALEHLLSLLRDGMGFFIGKEKHADRLAARYQ